MRLDKVTIGQNPPTDINVVVEISKGGYPIKYEIDESSGVIYVDRFLNTSMVYPANYGFIPHTLCGDGDPCDVLVIGPSPIMPSAVVRVRPIGALLMADEAGFDDKILAVPVSKLNPYHEEAKSFLDLPKLLLKQIAHFFQHYKDLEKGKFVSDLKWVEADVAENIILDSIDYAKGDSFEKRFDRENVKFIALEDL